MEFRVLKYLEEELGTTLFIRGKRSLTLTDDGLLFKQRAEEIVELTERASREFLERETISGIIVLGATEAVGSIPPEAYFCGKRTGCLVRQRLCLFR